MFVPRKETIAPSSNAYTRNIRDNYIQFNPDIEHFVEHYQTHQVRNDDLKYPTTYMACAHHFNKANTQQNQQLLENFMKTGKLQNVKKLDDDENVKKLDQKVTPFTTQELDILSELVNDGVITDDVYRQASTATDKSLSLQLDQNFVTLCDLQLRQYQMHSADTKQQEEFENKLQTLSISIRNILQKYPHLALSHHKAIQYFHSLFSTYHNLSTTTTTTK